jgi:hypothetical protein
LIARNISKKSLFKLLLAGLSIGSLLLWPLFSIVSIFVGGSIDISIESASGLAGFLETAIIWLFLTLGLAIVNRFTSLTIETKN